MEKKEKKKLLLAITLSILTLSGNAFAADVADWSSLKSTLESGQNATLSQSIDAGNQYIDMEKVNYPVSLNLKNNSINGTTLGTSALSPGFGEFSILDGTIQNFVNNGSYASEWGIAAMLGGALLNNGSTSSITNVAFNNNQAPFGGAVANLKAIDNTEPASQNTQITVTSTDTNYTGNKAQLGGAIFNLTTRMSGDNFSIEQEGEYAKNAIVNINAENSDVTFSGNSATIAGGAIFNMGTVNIEASEGHKVEFATASDDIYNNNELNLVSGDITINSSISDKNINLSQYGLGTFGGNGVTNVQSGANVVANAIDQNSLNIANGGTLTTNVNGLVIDNAISNNGTLSLKGNQAQWDFNNPLNNVDVLNENITGTGVTNFVSGNTQVSSNIGTEININGEETNVIVSNNNQGTITLGQSGKNITNTNGVLGIDKNVTLVGNLITGAGSETEILSAGSITSAVTNNGTIGIFDGTLGYDISGNGMVVVGGELTNNANITAGYIEIDGASTVLGQNYTGNLITNASNVTTTNGIVNNSLLTFTGGTNANSISGGGKTTITGAVTNNASIAQAIDIQTGTLITSADNIGGAVTNAGTVELTGGNLAQVITGGNINITQDLISSADNLKGAIVNTAELTLTGGELTQNIAAGAGVVNISGDVSNSAAIAQDVTISSGALTSAFENLTGNITNNSTLLASGVLDKTIAGNGTTKIDGEIKLTDNGNISGTLDFNNGTLNMQESGSEEIKYSNHTVSAITGSGNLKIDAGMADASSDKLTIGSGDGAALNLSAINIYSDHSGAGNLENYITYADGTLGGITFNVNGADDGTLVTYSSNYKYTFTKGEDGKLNVEQVTSTEGLKNFIEGNLDPNANTFSLTENTTVSEAGALGTTNNSEYKELNLGLNGYELNGSGDKAYDGITVADGYTLNVTGKGQVSETSAVSNFDTALTNNGTLNVSDTTFSGNNQDIVNNNILNLSGNNSLETGISGTGNMYITDGATINNGIISQNNIEIANGAALTTAADKLIASGGTVTNAGNLTLTGGAIQNAITGAGNLSITGDVTNDKTITQTSTSVADDKTFTNNGELNTSVALGANQTIDGTGTLNLTTDSSNAGSITQNALTNASGLTFTNTGSVNVSTLTNNGTISTAADKLISTEGITNNGALEFVSGANSNTITGSGALTISGAASNTAQITQNSLTVGADFENTGAISIDTIALNANITGDTGSLTLGGTNDISASVNTITQQTVTNNGDLTANVGQISAAIENNKTLALKGGENEGSALTNNSVITGKGSTTFNGFVNNTSAITQTALTNAGTLTNTGVITSAITNSGTLTSSADNIKGTLDNSGIYNVQGGAITNAITGTGTTNLTGAVTSSANIAQTTLTNDGTLTNTGVITAAVTNSGTLTSAADNIIGAVDNSGTYNIQGGEIANAITGTGTTNLTGNVTSSADITQTTVSNAGTFTNTGVISAAVTNSGTLTSSADNITGAVENTGTYNIEGGTIASAISGNGDVNLSGNVISNANNTVTGKVTVAEGATLSKGVSGNLFSDAAALNLENGATLSLADGTVDTTTSIDNLAIAQGSTAKLELDWGDSLNTANSDTVAGNIELSKVDLTTKSDNTPFTVSSTLQDKISLSSDIELVADEDSNYVNYDATTGQFNADKLTLNDAIAQGDANGVYQMTADESLSAGLGTLQGSDNTLSVNGGGYSIIGNDNEGVTVNDGQTLNLTNIKEIGGFKDSTAVTNNGTVNLSNVALNDKVAGSGDLNVNGDTTFNNAVSGNTLNLNSGVLALGQAADISGANAFVVNGGALNLQNNAIQNTNLGNVTLNSDLDLRLDGNFAQQQMDTITANSFTDNGNHINISNILITEPTTEKSFSISPLGTGMDDSVRTALAGAIQYTGGEIAYSPIYKYTASYDPDSAMLKFGLVGGGGGGSTGYESFNPAIMASPVAAQLGGYLVQLNSYDNAFRNMDMYMLMTKEQRQAMKMRNKYASANSRDIVFDPTVSQYENKAGWFRPFATFENVHLDNGPRVSNVAYGSYFGADSELYDLGNGWDGMWSVYAGYNGSHQAYDGIGIYQNGGTLGAVGMAYKGNYFVGLTANVGASAGEANSMFGHEDFTMLMSGVAAKTGYNWELAQGKFIIQPSMLMSYSFVNTFDYHNAAGVGINSDPLHAIQLEPGLKFIGNLKNGWQPYLGVSVVWNIMDNTQFKANDVSLPSLSIDPFVKYGVGVRKAWGERFTGFLQAYFTNGGRNGVGLQAGFRFTLGKSTGSSIKADNFTPEKLKTQVSLKSMK